MLARADCTPSGQFAPSVIIAQRKPRQGRSGEAVHSTLDGGFPLCYEVTTDGQCSRGFELPPAGAAAKARGGEAAGVSGKTQGGPLRHPPLCSMFRTPNPKSPEPQITFHKSEKS